MTSISDLEWKIMCKYMYVHLGFLYATKESSELLGSDFIMAGTLRNQVFSKVEGLLELILLRSFQEMFTLFPRKNRKKSLFYF
jgi:hypothetical protein